MNTRYLKLFTIVSALFFLTSCAVFVRDEDYHHRGHWHHHASIQQSSPQAISNDYSKQWKDTGS
ncbi:MAG TPA: hypothetical protein VMV04_08855 [Thermodesulfobacteriota bacterium]|nr:hypothetical protein [Thermodesulfobacteriota bacterium]